MRLLSWDYLKIDNKLKNDNVIVIDLTNKPWVKILGSVENNHVNEMPEIIRRHLLHCRCKTPVIMKEGSIYCLKCGYKIPYKTICFRSYITKKILKIKNIFMGHAIIENNGGHIILIDLDYARRNKSY